ncbi:MAG: Chitinase precursor [Bacteroidota bacterium]|jgi:PKD repeat protein
MNSKIASLLFISTIIQMLSSCDESDMVWNLPRKNDADSLQNQNSGNPKAPVASFSASSRSVKIGESVQFLNTSTQSPTTVEWQFENGDPVSSIANNPTVTYNKIGNHGVSLYVSNSFGDDNRQVPDYIETYYLKSFANNVWDGWVSTGWTFSSSPACPDCINAWQNSSNNPLSYTITRQFSNVSPGAKLEFYYNISSPGGTLNAKIDNVTVFTTSGFGSGTASVNTGNSTSFTVTMEAVVGYTQNIYLNDIRIRP